jgi:tripartite-type tricarboxylate transporter receptor subunit TctC
MSTRRDFVLGSAGILLAPLAARAQGYPTKPLRLIVPFAAGGTGDVLGRLIAPKLGEGLGQPVVLDFRPGAGTTLATEIAAKSPPDGYTILLSASTTMAINASLYAKLPYDTLKDLTAVTLLASVPNILVAHPGLPANTVQELIALAKSKPGALSYATPGSGTTPHLSTELFKNLAGIQMTHIPYKGAGPAIVDVVGGHVPLLMDNIPSVQANVAAGRLKVIGVTSAKRSASMPDAPTFIESGVAGLETNSWWAILVPAATPREIVARLNAEMLKVLKNAETRERFLGAGAEPAASTPEEANAHIRAEVVKWAGVVKTSGARVD